MNEAVDNQPDPLDAVVEDFLGRRRAGGAPSPEEYAAHYPELAGRIRALFPTLLMLEAGPPQADPTSPLGAEVTHPKPPEALGDFRIVREVGRGGMGVVYEAVQEPLGRRVALKVLPPECACRPHYRERFLREAAAAATLHHTNIVPVFASGEHQGTLFFAMQYIDGTNLADLVVGARAGNLRQAGNNPMGSTLSPGHAAVTGAPSTTRPPEGRIREAARWALQAAEALACAHAHGVLHRDIKPANLLLDKERTLWVADFGLAKAGDADDLTGTGELVGTLRYLAPERFAGRCDARSDIYALGATLYELLAGRPSFAGQDRLKLVQEIAGGAAPLGKVAPGVPADLATVVGKAMAAEPAERYASAGELADDLRRFLDDRPVRARRPSAWEQLRRWARHKPALAGMTAAVVLLLAALVSGALAAAWRLNQTATRAVAAEREARLREADALVGQAHGIRYSRQPGQRFDALAALQKAADIGRALGQPPEWFDALRNEAIAALALPDIHVTQSFPGLPPGTHRADVSPDFTLYGRTTREGACSIRRIADDQEVARLPALGEPACVRFFTPSLFLVGGESSSQNRLWELSGAEPVLRVAPCKFTAAEVRSDGRLWAVGHSDSSVDVYATDTGICKYHLPPGDLRGGSHAALHPREALVAVRSWESRLLQVRDLRTGVTRASVTLPWQRSWMSAWSPDGTTLAVSSGSSGSIRLYAFDASLSDLRLIRSFAVPNTSGGTSMVFNPAGDRLAVRGWGHTVHLFDVGTGVRLFSTPALQSTAWEWLHFDSAGRRLAACRVGTSLERIGLWSVADGREYRALAHDQAPPPWHESEWTAIHPDGRLIAQAVADGFALFDLESGQELACARFPGVRGQVAFDGRGNLLWNGSWGAYRWPLHQDPGRPARLTLGPPERLPFHHGDRAIAASRDGQVIAQTIYRGGGWLLPAGASEPRRLEAGGSTWTTVSPDGLWVAFGGGAESAKVFDVTTGRRIWQSPANGQSYCRFSRDGSWLLCQSDGGRAHRVGTWEAGPALRPGIPWDASPDSHLVVLGMAGGIYRLVERATGRELARLEDPEQVYEPATFTPDGTRLVVNAPHGPHIWDLRRIRAELAKLGLDWDAPPYPEVAGDPPGRLEVQIVGAERIKPAP